ncbi:MAG: hypothetical protein QE271_14105 [Bacteriovoracaceae bacterium]|nr:hypothetical protein [Bacteriovoracaceae bacterium]
MKLKFLFVFLSLVATMATLSIEAHASENSVIEFMADHIDSDHDIEKWSCGANTSCGQGGVSLREYYGSGQGSSRSAAQSAASANSSSKCAASCSSQRRPNYNNPSCGHTWVGSCTQISQ